MLASFYNSFVLKFSKSILLILSLFTLLMFSFALKLEIDASAETLLLEDDRDLQYTRELSKKFSAPDILVVTFSVRDDLLSGENLKYITQLSNSLKSIEFVESITNITNVPLLESPIIPITELVKKVPTLQDENIDKTLVKKEFLTSPIYKENLVSQDFKTTAILLNLKRDEEYYRLVEMRDDFVKQKKLKVFNDEEKLLFEKAKKNLKTYRDQKRINEHNYIQQIRDILEKFENDSKVKLHLGGATMIADDMVEFVKYDLKTFSIVIVLLVIVILYLLLRNIQWVVLPLLISLSSIIITSGMFGMFSWEVTVISSNYISLQLIMNISLVVHLIVKYEEFHKLNPEFSQNELLVRTLLSMAKPSFFVVITTIAGFSSLVFSGILPIITFGWMMSVAIVVSLFISFLLFPLFITLFGKINTMQSENQNQPFTLKLANIALNYKNSILLVTLFVIIFSISGATKLRVENSFIDYFKSDTEIYKGMRLVDKKLGGTTPLDIIITFKESDEKQSEVEVVVDDMMSEFDNEFRESKEDKIKYWFTRAKMDKVKQIHQYLETQNGIGKVLSLYTLDEIGKKLNNGKVLDSLSLALMYQELPKEYRDVILTPYVNVEANQMRISTRIIDSLPNLQRNELIKTIKKDLQTMINPKFEEVYLSNLLVIYNNMLQSLFDSQIKTMGVVVGIIFIMFLILFKDLQIAFLAIIANTVPISVIFGIMGWFNIPLDMMTITIAAISIGIAVDDTIHYIHRFRTELENKQYKDAVINSHKNIGRAMFYTSIIIMVGFSILVLSNFIPTIFFGILTMIAMFMAILADLLLLPVLLSFYKKKN
jgi:predicted RND superfamily exporter protein